MTILDDLPARVEMKNKIQSPDSRPARSGGHKQENRRMASNHIVLIGSQNPISGATTHGTGFLVGIGGECWIVTCRHVVHEAAGGNLFALPKPRKTMSPPGGYSVLVLGAPRFHPEDSKQGTYDVAVSQVMDVTLPFLQSHDIVPIDLEPRRVSSSLRDGMILKAQGYPIDYANTALAVNRNEPLLPDEIEGTVRSIPLQHVPQFGFDAPLREAFFAQTRTDKRSGKGMSGGLVYAANNDEPAGIVLASGDFGVSSNGRVLDTFCGFIFAGSIRIIEALAA